MQRPTATRLIAKLTEQGLVEREDHPDDRRSHRVAASAAGRALVQESRVRKTAYLAQALEHLSPEDQATLDRAAAILEQIMESEERP